MVLGMADEGISVNVSSLMARFRTGDREAADQLFSLLYPELRRLAAIKINHEVNQHSWQPSLLVNELYLHLVKSKSLPAPEGSGRSERNHFLNFAAHVMRHLLIDHSRLLSHRITKIDISKFDAAEDDPQVSLQHVDNLLERLAAIDPRLRSVAEMRVFEGLTVDEISVRLNMAPRTVTRSWAFCKQWLRENL
jgi:RNA polymerase sigma factor (TIGR02999 family)